MAHVRTYNPRVRVGNWKEDVTLEEETLKNFILQKERGQLTVQKEEVLRQNILKPVSLSVSHDGFLHFGDTVMLVNSGGGGHDLCGPCALSIIADSSNIKSHSGTNSVLHLLGPLQVGGATSMDPCVRNAFVITSVDGTSDGEMVRYDQNFALRTTAGFSGELYLASDYRTFQKYAKKSRLQELSLVDNNDFLCWWRVIYFDPQERLENEGYPVQVNSKVLISHCKTNQCLAALGKHILWTPFGKEYELTAHTFLDSHKAERDVNHWLFVTGHPTNQNQSLLQLQQNSVITDEHREDTEPSQETKEQ
ncbi:cilia- and flagella-associated protein 161-like isoform X1 [Myxocyprinus asiaticus]|uniref:cilia- and flagella-associated protein 161-like isoform X1 n=1 Tax=Myxocyprinus asiaticus TaxID=70543 RepID=UPI002223327F|nr:cilia- and flagella-associated protein 161-like isoform X1 [Myxocyprinus asiaticus]